MVADRLQTCVRPGDTVARQGGDEFALVLDALGTPEDAEHIAESIADALRPPFHISGRDAYVTASIGIAVSDSDGAKAEDLLRRADIAMYAAKRPGGGRHALFDPRHMEDAWQLFRLQSDLRHAIENDQLTLVYQPLVNLHDLTISEVEALVRWVHPVRGTLLPGEFIPKAEESGLIILLGEWVLRQACRQLRTWHLNDPERAGWSVAVNISARQLGDPTFVDDVRRILHETGLDPAFLELELTESAAIADMDTTRVTLHALNRLGIRLAIDDFGAGYAGLGYLRDCKVDALKIDRSFVAGLGTSAEDAAMIRAVLDVAGSLGLDVTAEGIESQEQLEQLRTMGCTRGQGYIFSRPLPAEEVPTHLRRPKLIAV
jgi:predicted signal transduction protein with EAL and GGDEF domain